MTAITVGEALVKIRPDSKGFAGDLDKQVTSPLRGLSKVALGIGAGIAAIGTARFLAGTVTDYVEAAKAGALTNQVIKSTGGIAGVSAKQVETLATKISNLSGIDDEAVQGAENMLLTFTNIGQRAFPDATKAVTDMATAMNGGLTPGADQLRSTAILVGKALNDPVRGLTALQRVGVRLTDSQKEQVKALVAANDTYGAQAIILGELSREFGGAAEAAADPISKLKVVLDNAKETIGGAIFPLVSQIVPVISTAVSGIAPVLADALGGIIGALQPVLKAIIPLLAPIGTALVGVIGALAKGLAPLFAPIADLFASLGPIVAQLADTLVPVVAAIAGAFGALLPALAPVAKALVTVIGSLAGPLTKILTTLSKVLVGALKILAPVIGQIATQLGKVLGTALKTLGPLLPELGKSFLQLLKAVAPLIPPLLKLVVAVMPLLLLQTKLLLPVMTLLAKVLAVGVGEAVSVVTDVLKTLTTVINQITFDDIGNGLLAAGNAIVDFFTGLPGQIVAALAALPGLLLTAGVALLTGLFNGIVQYAPTVIAWLAGLPAKILTVLAGLATLLVQKGIELLIGLGNGIINGAGQVLGWLGGLPGRIVNALGDVGSILFNAGKRIIDSLWDGMKSVWHDVENWLGDRADEIIDLKGPPARDRQLLVKNGQLIMAGLNEGLARGWGDTRKLLGSFEPSIGGSFGRSRGTSGSGGVTVTIHQTIRGNADAAVLARSNDDLVGALTTTLGQVG